MRLVYANCAVPELVPGDVLLTDEVTLAHSAPEGVEVLIGDALYDADTAEALNAKILSAAFDWFTVTGEDPTLVAGVSAGDLAGSEVAITLLGPAVRAWLSVTAALAPDGPLAAPPDALLTVVSTACDAAGERYRSLESLQCDAAQAAMLAHCGSRVPTTRQDSDAPANAALQRKYAQVRDWTWVVPERRGAHLRQALPAAIINAAASLRGRRGQESLLVYEYNPTHAFAEQYADLGHDRMRLVRCRAPRAALDGIVRHADRLVVPPRAHPAPVEPSPGLRQFVERHAAQLADRMRLDGIDLWPLIAERLLEVIAGYEHYAAGVIPGWRARLRATRTSAVVVPFDTPPEARALLAAARAEGIPAFLVNDGYKADDFSADGMTIDHVLAWSTALAENYYGRRRGRPAVVTGNPKADGQRVVRSRRGPQDTIREILIGSFTFSPVDLNCRRSDPETFLEEVLGGIASSEASRSRVRLKLHPADRPDHYREILKRFGELDLEILTTGDVVAQFDAADLYVTTYSTSLLEAVARDLPVVYYRVNDQRLQPPFSGDPILSARTASSTEQLRALLDDPALRMPLQAEARDAWVQRYLGAVDGHSTQRIEEAIINVLRRSAPQ